MKIKNLILITTIIFSGAATISVDAANEMKSKNYEMQQSCHENHKEILKQQKEDIYKEVSNLKYILDLDDLQTVKLKAYKENLLANQNREHKSNCPMMHHKKRCHKEKGAHTQCENQHLKHMESYKDIEITLPKEPRRQGKIEIK